MLRVIPPEKDRGWHHVRSTPTKSVWQCRYCSAVTDCTTEGAGSTPTDLDHADDCPMLMWAYLRAVENAVRLEED